VRVGVVEVERRQRSRERGVKYDMNSVALVEFGVELRLNRMVAERDLMKIYCTCTVR
jgi:hypothetical protein